MIARPLNRFKPIPFSSALPRPSAGWEPHEATAPRAPVQWTPLPTLAMRLEASEPPHGRHDNPWGTALSQLTNHEAEQRCSNDGSATKANANASAPTSPAPKTATKRSAMARYDGPHSLSIRSATSGRHYRFERPGDTQVIDAIDIALMRRIEDITLL